jgi:putative PEP-CTERM system TPR-repeat lipoprotein
MTMKIMKLAIVAIIALALNACGDKDSGESYLVKAKSHMSQNNVNESLIELKNALKLAPKNAEVRFLLGQLYLSQGRGADAVKELERASTFKYSQEQVIPLLARAYILTNADDDVLALSKEADNLSAERRSHYLAYKTLAALRMDKPELAVSSVALLKSLTWTSVYGFLAEGYLTFSQQKFDQAEAMTSRVLSLSPLQPDALMLQGQIALAKSNFKQAITSFEQYLTAQPYSGLVQLLLADALLKNGEIDKAEQHADKIIAKIQNQPFANYIKARVRSLKGDYQQAIDHAEVALQGNFKQQQLKLIAGASAFQLKNYERAYHYLTAVMIYLPQDHVARRMLAVSQLQLGLVDEISETLAGFESDSIQDAEFISLLSIQLFELGAVNQAKVLVKKSSRGNKPQDAKQSARKGILKLMMNDPSGMEELKNAVKFNPKLVEAELALAFAALQTGDIAQASAISTQWKNKYPNNPGGYYLMASIQLKEGELEKAKKTLEESLALAPDNIFALTELVKIYRKQGDLKRAKALVTSTLKTYPHNTRVLKLYFDIYRSDASLAKIKAIYQQDKNNVNLVVLYAEALMTLSKIDQGVNILTDFEASIKTPKKYWQILIIAYKQLNEPNNEQQTLEKWRKINPYHLDPIVLLADFFAQKREMIRALAVVKQGFENHSDNLILKMVEMEILLNSKQVKAAKTLYNDLSKQSINENLKRGIQGRIFLLEESYPAAIEKLIYFYNTYPSGRHAIYLAMAYRGNNQVSIATSTLEHHLLTNKTDDRVRAFLADLYLKNESDSALKNYQMLVKTQPQNALVNNNLAWLYMDKGDIDNALFYAKKAYSLTPEMADVVDTYAQTLFKSGKKRHALEQADKAYKLSAGKSVDITLHYIEVLIANGRKNEARKLLTQVQPQSDAQKEKAKTLLDMEFKKITRD